MYNIEVTCSDGLKLVYELNEPLETIKKRIATYKRLDKKYGIVTQYKPVKVN